MTTTLSLSDAIDQLIAEEALAAMPAWTGAPLGFTSRYYSAADLWGVTLLVDGRYQEGTTGRDVYESQEVH